MDLLTIDDFKVQVEEVKVINAWVDPEFQKEQERLGNVLPKTNKPVLIWCHSKIRLNTQIVEVTFNPNTESEISSYLPEINKYLIFIEANVEIINKSMFETITELKNRNWLLKNEKQYTIDTIRKKNIKIKAINFSGKNNYSIFYKDDGLFLGHDIEITMRKDRIMSISISG